MMLDNPYKIKPFVDIKKSRGNLVANVPIYLRLTFIPLIFNILQVTLLPITRLYRGAV